MISNYFIWYYIVFLAFCWFYFSLIYVITGLDLKLETIYEWKQLNYTPESFEIFNKYNISKGVPYDFEVAKDGRVFLSIIATKEVPISLTTITNRNEEYGPLLSPYPNLTWFLDPQNCNNITNVRSMTIDKCNRLWVLDTGRIGFTQVCNAKLLVFDLTNDKLLQKYELPRHISEDEKGRGVLVNPVIDTEGPLCKVKTVYIADSEGYALIIWNGKEFIRLKGPEFEPEDSAVQFNISGESFTLRGGIVPMDLQPGTDQLIFAPLASQNLYAFNRTKLANVFRGANKPKPTVYYPVLRKQPTALRWTANGQILFVGLADNSIDCWINSKSSNITNFDTAVIDNERLQFISSLKSYEKSKANSEEELWVLTTRLQKIINGSRRLDDINFRILKGSVKNLIKNTKCEKS